MRDDSDLKKLGVGRIADNDRALLVILSRCPTDDELRMLDDGIGSFGEVARQRDALLRTLSEQANARALAVARDESVLVRIEQYLIDEADFNRSWVDGRRGDPNVPEAYKRRRIELAEERERWAAHVRAQRAEVERLTACLARANANHEKF